MWYQSGYVTLAPATNCVASLTIGIYFLLTSQSSSGHLGVGEGGLSLRGSSRSQAPFHRRASPSRKPLGVLSAPPEDECGKGDCEGFAGPVRDGAPSPPFLVRWLRLGPTVPSHLKRDWEHSLAGSQGGQGHGLGRYREVNATELREEAWLASEMRVWKGPAWRKPWWDGKGGGPEPKPGLRAGEGLRLGVQGLGASKSQHSGRGRVGWKTASHRVRYRHEKPGRFRCCAFFSMPVCSLAWVQFWELPPSGFHRGRCRTLCPPGSQPSQGSPLPLVRDTECPPRPGRFGLCPPPRPSPSLLPLSLPLTHSAPHRSWNPPVTLRPQGLCTCCSCSPYPSSASFSLRVPPTWSSVLIGEVFPGFLPQDRSPPRPRAHAPSSPALSNPRPP